MDQEDPALDPLRMWAEQKMYDRYLKGAPHLVVAIQGYIEMGNTPSSVVKLANNCISSDNELIHQVFLLAGYLYRNRTISNIEPLKRGLANLN